MVEGTRVVNDPKDEWDDRGREEVIKNLTVGVNMHGTSMGKLGSKRDTRVWLKIPDEIWDGDGQNGTGTVDGVVDSSRQVHSIAVLTNVLGIDNCCHSLEKITKGIKGGVFLNKKDITDGTWYHQSGLKGERLQYYNDSIKHSWITPVPSHKAPLAWYRLVFSRSQLASLAVHALSTVTHLNSTLSIMDTKDLATASEATKESSVSPIISFSLYLGSMGKGMAWVNGYSIGRFWNRAGECEGDGKRGNPGDPWEPIGCLVSCSFGVDGGDGQSDEELLSGAGKAGGKDEIVVVLFEESGGDVKGVRVAVVAG
ncbi:Beta-galactosidase 6 [Blyttiomyces sp. JEL0837]|nr:Beta-galactosidase 6 [Blyttiomyces sp. JEL0837]